MRPFASDDQPKIPPVLVLNADWRPLDILPHCLTPWQNVVPQILERKITVVDSYPGIHVRSPSLSLPAPSVVALHR